MELLLHGKHGVNPTMTTCYYCNEVSEILLVGAGTGAWKKAGVPVSESGEMPRSVGVINTKPCTKCEELMKQGVILISVKDDQGAVIDTANINEKIPNPYRTGGWIVIKDEAVKRMILDEKILAEVLRKRMCFILDSVWDHFELPRMEVIS